MDIYIVLGYLGSGKTTFVINMLKAFKNGKNAVIVNDFGNRDVDGIILQKYTENITSIYGGSIFCSCKSDKFAEALLHMSDINPHRLIVEASGLASPYAMYQALEAVKGKASNPFELKGTITVTDALNFENMLSAVNAVRMQAACADLILINKSDIAGETAVNRVKSLLDEINPNAEKRVTVNAYITGYNIKTVKKQLPRDICDIMVQKAEIRTAETDKKALDEMCAKLSAFCHRIKGIVSIGGKSFIYEYTGGGGKTYPTDQNGNYIILLSCIKGSLKEKTSKIIKVYGMELA